MAGKSPRCTISYDEVSDHQSACMESLSIMSWIGLKLLIYTVLHDELSFPRRTDGTYDGPDVDRINLNPGKVIDYECQIL